MSHAGGAFTSCLKYITETTNFKYNLGSTGECDYILLRESWSSVGTEASLQEGSFVALERSKFNDRKSLCTYAQPWSSSD